MKIIGIGGPTGAGKTTLARELASRYGAVHLPLDHYYRDLNHLSPDECARTDFDHPDSLEIPLLAEHLRELKEGRPIARPEYCFRSHTRVVGAEVRLAAPSLLLVEGLLALYFDELRELYDLSVFVDAPSDLRSDRRRRRDTLERGRTLDSIERQYAATVRPAEERYVLPSRRDAQIVLDGSAAVGVMAERLQPWVRDWLQAET